MQSDTNRNVPGQAFYSTRARLTQIIAAPRLRWPLILMNPDWRDSRAGCALDLQRLENQREFVDSHRGDFIQLHVFQQMNAIHDQHDLVNGTGQLRIRIGRDLDRRIVGSDQHGILASHPFGGSYSDARSTCPETRIAFPPELAPA